MSAPDKPFETRVADLVRRLGSDFPGEVVATVNALGRLLASRGVTFTDFGDAVERLANGGLEEDAMKRVFAAGYARCKAEFDSRHAEAQAVFGLRADGSTDFEAIALHLQRNKHRFEAKHHEFIDDMSSRMAWGREPTEKQGKYLISLFRRIGGRMK